MTQTETINAALAWLQSNMPAVKKGAEAELVFKDKETKRETGRRKYAYADLTDVSEAILPLLGQAGLAWTTQPTMAEVGGAWRFVLLYELRHVSGEAIKGVWPLPDRADPQTVGSHITYGRRYCLCAVTGLAPGGDDDDGAAAKEAAGKGETLDEASGLSLPPQDTDYLLAMLQPDAMTPIADYPTMWERVVQRRAAGKPSPVEHDGHRLTWAQLFGYSLYQRAQVSTTPDDVMALWNEAKQIGWGKLPWQWSGQTLQKHLKERGDQIKADLDEKIRVAEHAITSASTMDELTRASGVAEALRGLIPDERMAQLGTFFGERTAALRRQEQEATLPAAEPVEQWSGDDDAPPAPDEPQAILNRFDELHARIWKGAPIAEMDGELLGAVERGEITPEQYANLHAMLFERPESVFGATGASRYTWLMWQINTAPNETALDAVKANIGEIKDHLEPDDPSGLNADEERSLTGVIAGRRVQMRGAQYR